MPELPEVQGVINSLKDILPGKVIHEVEIRQPSIVNHREDLPFILPGSKIRGFRRRGKYILLDLSAGTLLIHLRMTGKLLYMGAEDRHCHVRFGFEDGRWLWYKDVRKFGRILYFSEEDALQEHLSGKVGLEPMEMREQEFLKIMTRARGSLKKVLLDQHVIAGIGNIYADEILFRSRLHPLQEAESLIRSQQKRLFQAIQEVLGEALAAGGSTIRDYADAAGSPGAYQEEHAVYGRSSQPCLFCATALQKTVVAGRTTVYCPACQKRGRGRRRS